MLKPAACGDTAVDTSVCFGGRQQDEQALAECRCCLFVSFGLLATLQDCCFPPDVISLHGCSLQTEQEVTEHITPEGSGIEKEVWLSVQTIYGQFGRNSNMQLQESVKSDSFFWEACM